MRYKVYISGPITDNGRVSDIASIDANVRAASVAAQHLMDEDFSVFNPHLTVLQERLAGKKNKWTDWLDHDWAWVISSDAVLRLPGASQGADMECAWARAHDIPVFTDINILVATMKRPVVVGITGYKRSGKNTAGEALVEHFGFSTESVAKPIKDIASAIGWDGDKSSATACPSCGILNGRALLQVLGTEGGRNTLGAHVWVDALFRRMTPGGRYVVTDVRYPNEAAAIRDSGGYIIRVERDGYGPDKHASERSIDYIPVDVLLYNNGTIDQLQQTMVEWAEHFIGDGAVR